MDGGEDRVHWVYRDGNHLTPLPLCRRFGWGPLMRPFVPPVFRFGWSLRPREAPSGTSARGCARSCAGVGRRACWRLGPGASELDRRAARVRSGAREPRGPRHGRHQVWLRPILEAADNAMVHLPRMCCICRALGLGADTRRSGLLTPAGQSVANCPTSIVNRIRESAYVPIKAVRAYCRPLVVVQSRWNRSLNCRVR